MQQTLAALLPQPGSLALPIPQIVQPGPAYVCSSQYFHLHNARRVKQEGAFNTNTVRGYPPNRERCVRSASAYAEDGSLEDLHPLPLPLNDAHVHLDGIAGAQVRYVWIRFQLTIQ